MTNFSRSSVLKGAVIALALATFAGCAPKDGVKEFEQAKAAFELADYKKAEKFFLKNLVYAPENVEAFVYLARIGLELGEIDSAKEWYGKAAAYAGEDLDVKLLGAQILYRAKDYENSSRLFREVAVNEKNDIALRAQAFAGLGVVEMTANNFHLARIAFLRAIRLDRKCSSAWYHLGLLYRDSFGYSEAALDQFNVYARLDDMADVRVQKVRRAVIPGIEDTIRQTTASIPGASKRDSAAASTALVRGEASWKKGLYKTARQAYQEALKADPLSFKAAEALANAWLKTDTTKSGQEKAFENLKIACRLSPSSVKTFLKVGQLAVKLGYNAQSVEIYSRAVAANPTSIDALDGLIRSLRKNGKKSDANAYQQYRDTLARRK